MLNVRVASAHGLTGSRDLNKLADPYVVLTVGGKTHQTPVVNDTLEPIFSASFDLYADELRDASGRLPSLHFSVRDKDKLNQDEKLGECTVPIANAVARQEETWEETLAPRGGSLVIGVSWVSVEPYMLALGTLHVQLIDAEGLKRADAISRRADPYVKLTCGDQERRSRTVKRSLQPSWEERFSFSGRLRELIAAPLLLRVLDEDIGRADDELGEVALQLLEAEHDSWTSLARRYDLSLSTQGQIRLDVEWEPGPVPELPLSPNPTKDQARAAAREARAAEEAAAAAAEAAEAEAAAAAVAAKQAKQAKQAELAGSAKAAQPASAAALRKQALWRAHRQAMARERVVESLFGARLEASEAEAEVRAAQQRLFGVKGEEVQQRKQHVEREAWVEARRAEIRRGEAAPSLAAERQQHAQRQVELELAAVFAQLLPPEATDELALPREKLTADDLQRVHDWLEAEHARGAASRRAPELYAPSIDDCRAITAPEGSTLLDFEAEAVADL